MTNTSSEGVLAYLLNERALPDDLIARWLSEPASDLGRQLLGLWIRAQATELGIAPELVSPELAERIRLSILTKEGSGTDGAVLEKALYKSASGEFEAAGNLLRDFLTEAAIKKKYVPLGIARATQAADFKEKGVSAQKATGDLNRDAVQVAALKALSARKSSTKPTQRQLAKAIHVQVGLSENAVRAHLRALGLPKKI